MNVVNYAPFGLWVVRIRDSEKVLMEAAAVIGDLQRYWEAVYAKRPINLPALERLDMAHIPCGVPGEWSLVHDYTLQDLQDGVKHAMSR